MRGDATAARSQHQPASLRPAHRQRSRTNVEGGAFTGGGATLHQANVRAARTSYTIRIPIARPSTSSLLCKSRGPLGHIRAEAPFAGIDSSMRYGRHKLSGFWLSDYRCRFSQGRVRNGP